MSKYFVYIGTYTEKFPWVDGKGKGIYLFHLDTSTGHLTPHDGATGFLSEAGKSPTYLCLHPSKKYLYTINEIYDGNAKVSAFSIDHSNGHLKLLNEQSTHGTGGCHSEIDKEGKFLFASNYGSGSLASFPIHSDGSLGEAVAVYKHSGSSVNKERQEGPHTHGAFVDHQNKYVSVADLGIDRVIVYQIQSDGKLQENASVNTTPGAGPRHFVFHPSGKYAYVVNELDCTVTAFSYDAANGKLNTLNTVSTLPCAFQSGFSCAAIRVSSDGKTLWASNRGHNSIASFSVNESSGSLELKGVISTEGKTPRDFDVDPSGKIIVAANQDTSNLVTFSVDAKTHDLKLIDKNIACPSPVSVLFLENKN
eukprot:TRINITY_DN707_c0_g1_i1.p1 TRINITY_DN707_c0_g1~~TRINITY_DN707_c0_g1_i1.p1  ORF type:complete len:365 (+),score=59.63 TRINITY_DN707_c0_g1_i1:20-1114(+)